MYVCLWHRVENKITYFMRVQKHLFLKSIIHVNNKFTLHFFSCFVLFLTHIVSFPSNTWDIHFARYEWFMPTWVVMFFFHLRLFLTKEIVFYFLSVWFLLCERKNIIYMFFFALWWFDILSVVCCSVPICIWRQWCFSKLKG